MVQAFAVPLLFAITIVGYNDMAAIFSNLNALFLKTHPGAEFNVHLKGTATAAPALTLAVSDLAPMGAEFSDMELDAYRSFVGVEPVAIRIAHCSLNPRALSAPIGIYVNEINPIQNLTTAQVARIFTAGNPEGDITHWGQAGLTGEWAARPVHQSGIAEEAAAGLASFMLRKMSGRPFVREYEALTQSAQVVQHVREDPYAIGFASGNIAVPGVKLVPINDIPLTNAAVMSGKYPYDRYLLIYLRRAEPLLKEYLRLALSNEGQQAIAAAPPHYLALNEQEISDELAKLDLPLIASNRAARASNAKIALYRLIAGTSPYALMDREIWPLEARPFRQTYGYDPTAIRIAHSASHGLCVNAGNPLVGLTMEQVARIFTSGGGTGDITRWSQLGWSDRAIHLYGPHDNGTFVTALRHAKMGGLPFARTYEPLSTRSDIVQAIANDPYGIAIVESQDSKLLSPAVRVLPLPDLSSSLTLYLNRAPGKSVDSSTEQYARKLLSPESQAKLASEGYQPLSANEIAAELKKL